MGLHRVTLCLILLAVLAFSRAEARAAAVDHELVLAVDVSGSIDAREKAVQRDGYLAAIRAGPLGKIKLAYVEWAGDGAQRLAVPWRVIDAAEAAQEKT